MRSRPQARRPRTVVVTGASSGIGRATALAFARLGDHVVLAARDGAALQRTAAACAEAGGRATAVVTDVADPDAVAALGAAARARGGRIDVWINAAGVLHFGRLEDTPAAVLRRLVEVNLLGHIYGAQAALGAFRAQGEGVLINISSVLGVVAQPFSAAYGATKFGVRGLSEALRQEVGDTRDIHVCTVLPGPIDTPIYARAANHMGRELLPIRWLLPPDEVARACVRLARRPRRETAVGPVFGAAVRMGVALAPALSEQATGALTRRMQIGDAPVAPTAGNLLEPRHQGSDIDGGWRRRWTRTPVRPSASFLLAAGLLALGASKLLSRNGRLQHP